MFLIVRPAVRLAGDQSEKLYINQISLPIPHGAEFSPTVLEDSPNTHLAISTELPLPAGLPGLLAGRCLSLAGWVNRAMPMYGRMAVGCLDLPGRGSKPSNIPGSIRLLKIIVVVERADR